jgi:hypothetical protein
LERAWVVDSGLEWVSVRAAVLASVKVVVLVSVRAAVLASVSAWVMESAWVSVLLLALASASGSDLRCSHSPGLFLR